MLLINDYNYSDINDLVETREKGWRELAKLCNRLNLKASMGDVVDSSLHECFRIIDGFGQMFVHSIGCRLGYSYFLFKFDSGKSIEWHLCRSLRDEIKDFKSKTEIIQLRNLLSKFLKVFLSHDTLKGTLDEAIPKPPDAFSIPRNIDNYFCYEFKFSMGKKDHRVEFSLATNNKGNLEKGLSTKIEKRWFDAVKWLIKGLGSQRACEEAWWNCFWLAMKPQVEELLEIKKHIIGDVPLSSEQLNTIDRYLYYGRPRGKWFYEKDYSQSYKIVLRPYVGPSHLFDKAINALLCQPAYVLARQLENKHSKGRYVRQCRAPSCGKSFYTGRKNANACPGSKGDKKNECSLEWVRYKRYLLKTSNNPEADWDNNNLKKQFIEYDKNS